MQSSVCRLGDAVQYVLCSISTTTCLYATYLLKFFSSIVFSLSVLLPTSRQQSYLSHNHSFSRPCNGQILVSVLLIFYFACAVGCLPPYLMVHCGCKHPSFFGLALVDRRPHYFVLGVMHQEGCLRHVFLKTPPPSKRKTG